MIRRAIDSDVEHLIALISAHAQFERAPLARAPEAAQLSSDLADRQSGLHVWVAQRDDELVGYASGSIGYSTWHARRQFNLDCLYLSPQARGFGLGRSLMEVALTYARQQGCAHAEWVTPAWNVEAIRFYEALGAACQVRQRFRLYL